MAKYIDLTKVSDCDYFSIEPAEGHDCIRERYVFVILIIDLFRLTAVSYLWEGMKELSTAT